MVWLYVYLKSSEKIPASVQICSSAGHKTLATFVKSDLLLSQIYCLGTQLFNSFVLEVLVEPLKQRAVYCISTLVC